MNTESLHKESIEQLKERAFYNYFDSRVQEKDGVGIYMDINDGRLIKYFMELYRKYGYKRDWEELRADYVYIAWQCIHNFKPDHKDEKQGWINILDETNKSDERQLVGYIKETAVHEIRKLVYPDSYQTTTKRSRKGKGINYTIVFDASSIDSIMENPHGDGEMGFDFSEEENIFNDQGKYFSNPLIEWFEENKERILMPSQLEFLEQLNELGEDFTREEYESLTGRSRDDYARALKQMQRRIRKAYEKERPILKTQNDKLNKNVIEFYEGYLEIVNDDSNLCKQNERLSEHLSEGVRENPYVKLVYGNVIHSKLEVKDRIEFREVYEGRADCHSLCAQSLYNVTEFIKGDLQERKESLVEREFIEISELENVTYDEKGNYRRNKWGIDWDEIKAGSFFKLTTNALPVKKEDPEEEQESE